MTVEDSAAAHASVEGQGMELCSAPLLQVLSASVTESRTSVVLPLQLPAPPRLPPVDSHVQSTKLHMAALAKQKNQLRNATRKNVVQLAKILSPEEAARVENIAKVFRFIDSCGNSDGEVDVDELDAAFRRSRRTKALEDIEQRGRQQALRFQELLRRNDTTIKSIYEQNHLDPYTGGIISVDEIRKWILAHSDISCNFSADELSALFTYIDIHREGHITEKDCAWAFKRAHKETTMHSSEVDQIDNVLAELERTMRRRNMRVIDIFNSIDSDQVGTVSLKEFEIAITSLLSKAEWQNNAENYPVADINQNHVAGKIQGRLLNRKNTNKSVTPLDLARKPSILSQHFSQSRDYSSHEDFLSAAAEGIRLPPPMSVLPPVAQAEQNKLQRVGRLGQKNMGFDTTRRSKLKLDSIDPAKQTLTKLETSVSTRAISSLEDIMTGSRDVVDTRFLKSFDNTFARGVRQLNSF